jgi:hypothetical protein
VHLEDVPAALPGAFPYLPGQSGYNKRLRAALPLLKRLIRVLAADTDLWTDPVWLVDPTPVECARSRPIGLGDRPGAGRKPRISPDQRHAAATARGAS